MVLKREAVTTRDYTATYGTFDETQRNDTVFIHMPFGHKQLPDFNIEPASIHQRFDVTKKGNAITVKVTDEAGNDSTTVYLFQETKNNIAALSGITAEDSKEVAVPITPTFDGDVLEYTVTAAEMPIFSYTKTLTAKDETMGQTVDITYTADSATLLVTAGDGVTTRKYVIYRNDPTVTTKGQIKEFNKGGEPWAELGGETYSANGAKTDELITFERVDATDSVVYIQSPTQMEWKVFGTENHSYVLHYPTDQSTNANLANILIGGQPYADFLATTLEYDIESDTMLIIEAVEAEAVQRLTLAQKMEDGVVVYEDTVRAESGAMQVYKIRVSRPKSTVNTLSGIMLDSVLIEGFDPNTFDYTVELPVPAVKTEQPKMPSLTYLAGQKGQTIRMKTGEMNGDATELVVTSEAGVDNTYFVTVKAAKSSCVDLSGILVNGVAIEQFEAGRHFYSQSLKTNAIAIDYTSDDRFQTVNISSQTIKPELQYEYTLEVVAENGAKANYEVMIYVENQSNDAQLANILLDGKDFVNFERALNADLVFDGGNNSYVINLPSGTTIWPEVSAQLKMDGQSVAIDRRNDSVLLDVTAMDGITHNVYALRFAVPKSTNTELSMIFLNGAELEGFRPDKYFYVIALAEGEHEMPEVVPQKSESAQICDTVWDRKNQQVTIPVTAEDASVNAAYNIVFQFTQSAADTLLAIYADGVKIAGFDPHKLHYTDSLAVGTVAFPDLSWEEVNEWQTIRLDTVSMSPDSSQLVRSITVTAENGYSNTYIVSYVIRKSEVNTLQMLIIDQKELSGFVPTKEEYYYTLTAAEATELNGALPKVEFIEGDEYQSVFVAQALDSLSGKSLGYKSVVTVTAASGSSRTYTIHYPVEMSSDATLNMVMLGGKPLSNYDAERFTYKVEIEMGDAIPVVSVIKKEDAQTYEIRVENDTVRIDVWAENTDYTQTYTLSFERLLSAVTTLHDIILRDADSVRFTMAQFPFRSDEYTYSNIEIPYSADSDPKDLLPSMEFVLADSLQTVDTVLHMLPNGDIQVEVKVTAANGEDEAAYSLTFHFLKPSDAKLTAILVNGELIEDFRPDVTDYTIMHPYGTAPEDYVTIDSISYVLSDSLAVDTIYMSEDSIIYIVITAQDGTTEMTYMISQKTAPDGDNALAWITVDDAELREFEPETTFYTYYLLPGGAAPAVDAGARSENAEVSVREASAGDTCMIICTAADGKERRYYIHFAFTEVDPGVNATGNDVLVKRVPGSMQIMAATVRQGVTFALYDRHGQLVLYERVPVANPNDADVVIGSDNAEHLNNVIDTRSGLLIELIPGEPYFYSFFLNEKTNLGGGKIMGF